MDTSLFEDRVAEIDEYLGLLTAIDRAAKNGPPMFGKNAISTCQQRMLCSSVYLHLYNLVEATATWCLASVVKATSESKSIHAGQLSPELRREWVRAEFSTHQPLGMEKRLTEAERACEQILNGSPVGNWEFEKGGGSWDNESIQDVSKRVGCRLRIEGSIRSAALRPYRDDKNALQFVKDLRCKLAHGSISFEQSGESTTADDLVDLKTRTVSYLREVLGSFEAYVDAELYLEPAARGSTASGE